MSSKVQQEIADLKKLIRKWDKEYYVDSLPSVEDFVYDKHILRLQELESKYPEYKTLDSPTLKFGSDRSLTVIIIFSLLFISTS